MTTAHELTYTGHEHLGPARHRVNGKCSCGKPFTSTALTDVQARGNVREKHNRHKKQEEAAHGHESA